MTRSLLVQVLIAGNARYLRYGILMLAFSVLFSSRCVAYEMRIEHTCLLSLVYVGSWHDVSAILPQLRLLSNEHRTQHGGIVLGC